MSIITNLRHGCPYDAQNKLGHPVVGPDLLRPHVDLIVMWTYRAAIMQERVFSLLWWCEEAGMRSR